ncbi:Glycosyl hydrolases family 35 [Streptomyces aidingensis]|uniref:Glycosyl hydrolases family 35 n=2 Tax=Streptomyces aidingensis TaxID=910347 RepID=A0A1I1MQG7_9ACTN|nr:Glycosyl hydrolases family 35 [Streptomyces aidingensis]SFD09784.1 Glycosyl hydrolases family 35 [Streptomyces aidingensis]
MLLSHVRTPSPPLTGHLPMGSAPGTPRAVSVDSRCVQRDGDPWIPVTGEFHFSRYPAAEWREELLKMRAGGVDTVATYLFWNQHEEHRGVLRFDGGLDVRRFVGLCGELGLAVVVRIGPWAHGECRNGGFPGWLADTGCTPRTDDPAYLDLVRPYYTRIARELRGLSHDEGGPIVAVQVENELYDQPAHLATLRRTAEEAGLRAPLWTATAWGAADLPADVLLPLYGGYPEAFWEDAHKGWARHTRRHYFFTPIRDDHAIGADLRSHAPAGTGPDDRRYPYATCELGGGMAIAYHRRPLVPAADITSLALAKLGSGSVWQGYYLYHGSSQRLDHERPNQESHDTGYPNDLPAVTYDFQAPLGEYGQVRPSFHALRLHHLFLRDCGADLARMEPAPPEAGPDGLDDRTTLRWTVRSDGRRGFLFVNNHQPHEPLPRHDDARFRVRLDDGRTVTLPDRPVTLPSGAHFVWPIGHDLGHGIVLDWATAQPVTRLPVDGVPTAVLAATAGVPVTLSLPAGLRVAGPAKVRADADGTLVSVPQPGTDALLTIHGPAGRVRVLVVDEHQALTVNRVHVQGEDRLVLSEALVLADGDELRLHTTASTTSLAFLPAPDSLTGTGLGAPAADGAFTRWPLALPGDAAEPTVTCVRAEATVPPARTGGSHDRASAPRDEDFDSAVVYHVSVPREAFAGRGEVLLRVAYTGDVARAYIGGRLVADHFWYGPDWEIGLRRFAEEAAGHGVEIRVLPLAEDSEVYVDASVRDGLAAARERACVDRVSLVHVHRATVRAADGAGHD